ncbi:MAG: sucrose phosphorylase, partial [Leuconostoc sp.]|nr:sucrose phosphorylase [Leuconostoc sp.]
KLLKLWSWRNNFAAFDLDGSIDVETPSDTTIKITRKDKSGENVAVLVANAADKTFTITANGEEILANTEADKQQL